MSQIVVKNISKTFKVAKKQDGKMATLKHFFKREYKYIEAIKDISFSIEEGEIVGYIGPNGAGKSTTIKMLSGILVPDSGEIKVNGKIPYKERETYVKDIGVVFGQRSQLWWDIPARDTFELLKDIYKIDEIEYQKTKDELIDILNLKDIIDIPVRQLSLGQRMRLEIAASLLHKPKILFLDEPTIGLDAVSKQIVRDFIKKINKKEKITIILTTHDMNDIEALANRIILIGKGTLLYDGSLNTLKRKYDNNRYIEVITKDKIKNIRKKGIINFEKTSNGYKFIIDSKLLDVSSFINYISEKVNIVDMDIKNESIDNIIINLYKEFEIWVNIKRFLKLNL